LILCTHYLCVTVQCSVNLWSPWFKGHMSRSIPWNKVCLPSSIIFFFFFLFFCNEPIWLGRHSKKMKLWRLPKIKGYVLKCRVHPLSPTYIGERRTTFAK
jgi:hypothetical protein